MSGTSTFYNAPAGADASPMELFGSSWLQDSGMARNVEEGVQVVRRFGAYGPQETPGYNAFRDEGLRDFLVANPDSLHMFGQSRSAEESGYIQDRVKQLKGREEFLTNGGAFLSRMAAGVLSPEALATLPVGLGAATATTRLARAGQVAAKSAGINAGLTLAEDLSEAGSLPDSIAPNIAADVALSALFGAALGGLAGGLTAKAVDLAAVRHGAMHDAADGLRTPGVPREVEVPVAPREAPARLTPSGETEAREIIDRIGGGRLDAEFGQLESGIEAASIGPLVRFSLDLADTEVSRVARHEAIHGLKSTGLLQADEWDVLEATAKAEGWQAKHGVDARWKDQGLDERQLLEESIAEEFQAWARSGAPAPATAIGRLWEKMKTFFTELAGGLRDKGMTADGIFGKVESGEVGRRTLADFALSKAADAVPGPRLPPGGAVDVGAALRQMGPATAKADAPNPRFDRVSETTLETDQTSTAGRHHYTLHGKLEGGGHMMLRVEATANGRMAINDWQTYPLESNPHRYQTKLGIADADLDGAGEGPHDMGVRLGPGQTRQLLRMVQDQAKKDMPGWEPKAVSATRITGARTGRGRIAEVDRDLGGARFSVPPAPAAPGAAAADPASQRFAPGSGAKLITWSQMKYYVLKNNPFQGTSGQALARWSSELMQDPGLRMEGVNVSDSVEARTKQGGWRFAEVTDTQDRLYYQHAGFDPASATPARVRLEEARQRLPGRLGAVPDSKLTMSQFNDAVFLATAGRRDPSWPPEVLEAAKAWRDDFFVPYEREMAESGVTLSAKYKAESEAAVVRELDGHERRAKALKARIKDPKVPDEVRERFQALFDREEHGAAIAEERLKGLADMKPASEPYVFHNWLKGKVKAERDGLVDILAKHWNGERPRGSWAPGHVRAEIAVSHLQGDGIADTLEAAIRAQRRLDGEAPDVAAAGAAGAVRQVRQLMADTAPSRLGIEIRSALAWRKDHPPTKGLAEAVKDALTSQGMDVETHEGKLFRSIFGEPEDLDSASFGDRARPGHAKERSIDVPTHLIADYLDPNMKAGGADYARRMSAAVEMSNKMGDPSMLGRLNQTEAMLLEDVIAGRNTLAQVDEQLEAARAARDVVLGQYRIPEDPSAISIRALRFLSNSAVMAQMGSSLWANVTDMGRVVMAHGLRDVMGAAYQSAVVDRAKWRLAGDEAAKAGAALEITLLGRQRELQALHDIAADANIIEKVADQGAKAMAFVNLVAPWTETLQRFSGAMHQSEMVELAVKARDGTLDPAGRTRLSHYGMDDAMAARVADSWQAAGGETSGKLHLANTDAWADKDLARTFRAQLATALDASVMRPGAADKPNFMSAQLWQTTLLYKGFGIGASQRLVMAGMQQRDGQVLSGMLASVSIAWLVGGAASGPYDDHPIMSSERLFQAIDRSGVMGIASDVNNALQLGSGNALGLHPLLNAIARNTVGEETMKDGTTRPWIQPPTYAKDPNWAQRTGVVAGAAIAPWLGAVGAFTDSDATGDQRAGAVRRLLPFNNLLWLKDGFRAVQREVGSGIDFLEDDGFGGKRRAIALP